MAHSFILLAQLDCTPIIVAITYMVVYLFVVENPSSYGNGWVDLLLSCCCSLLYWLIAPLFHFVHQGTRNFTIERKLTLKNCNIFLRHFYKCQLLYFVHVDYTLFGQTLNDTHEM